MTSSTPGRLSKMGASRAPLLPVMPIAVRVRARYGVGLEPARLDRLTTPRICSGVASCPHDHQHVDLLAASRRPSRFSAQPMLARFGPGGGFAISPRYPVSSAPGRSTGSSAPRASPTIQASRDQAEGRQTEADALAAYDLVMLGHRRRSSAPGIFATIGTAAVGDAASARARARPSCSRSCSLRCVCALAALCYAEFAAMVPVVRHRLHLRLRDARASSSPGSSAGT